MTAASENEALRERVRHDVKVLRAAIVVLERWSYEPTAEHVRRLIANIKDRAGVGDDVESTS